MIRKLVQFDLLVTCRAEDEIESLREQLQRVNGGPVLSMGGAPKLQGEPLRKTTRIQGSQSPWSFIAIFFLDCSIRWDLTSIGKPVPGPLPSNEEVIELSAKLEVSHD